MICDVKISKALMAAGIMPGRVAYDYAHTAVALLTKNPDLGKNVHHGLWDAVAEMHHTTAKSVSRALSREAIIIRNTVRDEVLEEVFGRAAAANHSMLTAKTLVNCLAVYVNHMEV